MKNFDVIIFFDTIEDRLIKSSLELIGFARALGTDLKICGAVAGKNISGTAGYIARKTGLDVAYVESDGLYLPDNNLLAEAAAVMLKKLNSENICFIHTPKNSASAASIAVKMNGSCITGVESVLKQNGDELFIRQVFNGRYKQTVRPLCGIGIFTVLQGAFPVPPEEKIPAAEGRLFKIEFTPPELKFFPRELSSAQSSGVKLEDADIIISAGRGIGSEENLAAVEELASIFKNSAVGASRPVCDLKWMPYSRQVGVTGRTVSPRLYIALGISGSQQHIAGMKGSQCIVAVNTDPHAAIFSVADYIILEDAVKFIPELINACSRMEREKK